MKQTAPEYQPNDEVSVARPGRLSRLGAGVAQVVRQRWFLLLMRDALLFLAVALATLAIGNRQVIWRLWWPLPLSLAAGLMTLALHGASPVRWRHLGLMLVFIVPLIVRARLSIGSPLPAAGLREARELGLILCLGITLWVSGSCHPARTLAAWVAGILVGGLAGWTMAEDLTGADQNLINNNFRVFTLITLGAGALAGVCLGIASGLRPRGMRSGDPRNAKDPRDYKKQATYSKQATTHQAPYSMHHASPRLHARYAIIDLLCLVFLALGLAGGGLLAERQLNAPLSAGLAIQTGLTAQRALWLQSIIFGWGDAVLGSLIRILAEPALAVAPPWGGLAGALARGGIAGIIVLAGWSLVLNRIVRRAAGHGASRALILPAGLAAFFLLGLLTTGAPHTRLGSLALAGWMGLALIRPVAGRGMPAGFLPRPGFTPVVLLCLLLVVLTGTLALPTYSDALVTAVHRHGMQKTPDWARRRLNLASGLNPWNPEIPLAEARTRQRAVGGTETDYIRIVRLFQDAQRLDPYNSLIALRLANVQLQNDRQEEAVSTVRAALERRPNAPDLLVWMFGVALRLNQNALADQVLQQALALDPMNSGLWQHQFALARRLGQGPLAAQALATALTGAPDNPILVSALWAAANTPAAAPAAEAAVPAAGVPGNPAQM